MLCAVVHPADAPDRAGALPLLRRVRRRFPFVEVVFADGGYQGTATAEAVAAIGCWRLEVVKRSGAAGFTPLPKPWIVERTFSWLNRCRRLARDVENLARTALTFILLAMSRLMLRRLARASQQS